MDLTFTCAKFILCFRDYCHVVDLAKGHVHCMNMMLGPNSNKVWAYNLGTGRCKKIAVCDCRSLTGFSLDKIVSYFWGKDNQIRSFVGICDKYDHM